MSTIPVFGNVKDVYGPETSDVEERYAKLAAAFTQTHGEKPDLLARSPGRVNLIGEHIDYEGYSCLLYTSPSPRDLSTSRMPSSA